MYKRIRKISSAIALCVVVSSQSSPAWCAPSVFSGNTVAYLGGGDTRPCAFFTLSGVSQADPAAPGGWFGLPKAHSQYKETFALLLSAKLAGKTVYVVTAGGISSSCGVAEVLSVSLEP